MKNILLSMFVLFTLTGCINPLNYQSKKNDHINDVQKDEETEKEDYNPNNVNITKIEYCYIDWDQVRFSVNINDEEILKTIKPIDNDQTAIEVGNDIIERFYEKGKYSNYILLGIVCSTKDNIWVFEYSLDQRETHVDDLIDCGGLYIAIDGVNGRLIEAWVEE